MTIYQIYMQAKPLKYASVIPKVCKDMQVNTKNRQEYAWKLRKHPTKRTNHFIYIYTNLLKLNCF